MHEESETVQRKDGRWINVYGEGKHRTGRLPGSKSYPNEPDAVAAAIQRSAQHTEPDAKVHGPLQPRPASKYDKDYDSYMQDIRQKLDDVRGNKRSYTQPNVYAPKYNRETHNPQGHFRNPSTNQQWEQGMIEPTPEGLSAGLQMLERGNMGPDFDIQAHHQRLLTTGPFEVAARRQAIWAELASKRLNPQPEVYSPLAPTQAAPVQVAQIGFGGSQAGPQRDQMRALMEQDRPAPQAPQALQTLQTLQPSPVLAAPNGPRESFDVQERNRKLREAASEAMINKHRPQPKPLAKDDDLDAAVAAEDARLARERR